MVRVKFYFRQEKFPNSMLIFFVCIRYAKLRSAQGFDIKAPIKAPFFFSDFACQIISKVFASQISRDAINYAGTLCKISAGEQN